MSAAMSAADILREARSHLFEFGWHQGSMWGDDGSSCSMGAMWFSAFTSVAESELINTPDLIDVNETYREALQDFCEAIGSLAIGEWNDDSDRTFDDVVDAFDRAEKIAEQRETQQ